MYVLCVSNPPVAAKSNKPLLLLYQSYDSERPLHVVSHRTVHGF